MAFRFPGSETMGNGYQPGLHRYSRIDPDREITIHLRIAEDGKALMILNADRVIHLNPSAAYMTWLHLEGHSTDQSVRKLRKRFQIDAKTARSDYLQVVEQTEALFRPEEVCPIHDLDLNLLPPFSEIPEAPYRMDLALTYRCNENCAHCYNARPRSFPEMETQSWKEVIDRLWDIGIPHICFTGGEATLRKDLPELIAHAQRRGQITGLLTNGRRLSDRELVLRLVDAGLDHIQITIESHDAEIHDHMVAAPGSWKETVAGIRFALEQKLYLMTNTTLLRENFHTIGDTIDFLAELGVPTVGLNALIYAGKGRQVGSGLPEEDLEPLLKIARRKTENYNQRLIWYTPTQYCHFDPIQMELGVKACSAARYNMCVEPDGGVIPCQSYYHQVGKILRDTWESIWEHELCVSLRDRSYIPEKCEGCAILSECGGGCPLMLQLDREQQILEVEFNQPT